MKQIIVLDAREGFLSDLSIRLMLDQSESVNVQTTLNSPDGIGPAAARYRPELLALCENLVPEGALDPIFYETPTVGYGISESAAAVFSGLGIPYLGIAKDTDSLIKKLEEYDPEKPQPAAQQVLPQETQPPAVLEPPVPDKPEPPAPAPPEKEDWENELSSFGISEKAEPTADKSPSSAQGAVRAEEIRRELAKSTERRAAAALEERLRKREDRTKTITVYSAKGGVGKTTLASELAVYLSLTSKGRERFKICLLDYNIDFGDVLTTLNLDAKGPNMSQWAAEIRERAAAGEDPSKITYSPEEVKERLQVMQKTGLYVLPAPLTHEDSMDIGELELSIILSSVKSSGLFDFVVCDTGNNTRDSTILSLEAADTVLLVATQNVAAANCNDAFLNTMSKIGFEMAKIRLVVNDILPERDTGISVREVEDTFPYPCIARIRHHADVIKANNFGTPLVYTANHEYTRELQKVVAALTGTEPQKDKKSGLMGLLRGGK